MIVRPARDRDRVTCCARDKLCDRCVDDAFAHLRGVAACRGERWASTVAARCPTLRARPWPRYDGRAAELARRKVDDLTRDGRLRELLAGELARWAARRWAM